MINTKRTANNFKEIRIKREKVKVRNYNFIYDLDLTRLIGKTEKCLRCPKQKNKYYYCPHCNGTGFVKYV
jgi:hypothetical protein